MSIKSLNAQLATYKEALASGELQETYQNLVAVVQSLRTICRKKYKGEYAVAGVLHGYIDFTYFYLQNDYLKNNKLKLAIVLNHQKVQFELWLLGQTKDVQVAYWEKMKALPWVNGKAMPDYSIVELTLLAQPDFDDMTNFTELLVCNFEKLSEKIINQLASYTD